MIRSHDLSASDADCVLQRIHCKSLSKAAEERGPLFGMCRLEKEQLHAGELISSPGTPSQ